MPGRVDAVVRTTRPGRVDAVVRTTRPGRVNDRHNRTTGRRRRVVTTSKTVSGLLLLSVSLQSAAASAPCYAREGIASRYPGDLGIEKDPAVVFVERFEEPTLDAVKARWDGVKDAVGSTTLSARRDNGVLAFSSDVPLTSAGTRSLLVTHKGGSGTGGHLYRRLLPGYEKLHLRYYVKFDPGCWNIHHFARLGGYRRPTMWPQGGAGRRPRGTDRFSCATEPCGKRWRWDFYTYWMEMRSCDRGRHYWGNDFLNDHDFRVDRGRWICVELMVKLNSPVSKRNGEQAMWIDGELHSKDGQVISHLGPGFPKGRWVVDSWHPDPAGEPFEGYRWRKSGELKINYLWMLVYITTAPEGHVSKVWFDDIVVAREYIGPTRRL